MCLIALACNTPPGTALILAANRDEQYARASAPADWWTDAPDVLGGRDLVAGGSWLAISKSGRLAAVTNVRQGRPQPAPQSRGRLVADFVGGHDTPLDYLARLRAERHAYAPFNLLFGTVGDLYVYHSPLDDIRRLSHGVHGISNGRPDADWPKVERLTGHLRGCRRPPEPADMLGWLNDREPAPVEALPNTGVGLALEKFLSPVFIHGPDYGTRASTVLLVGSRGDVRFAETGWHAGRPTGTRQYSFRLAPATGSLQGKP